MRTTCACFAALQLLAGCTTSRFYDLRFQPAPLEAEVATQAVAGAQVRALATVIGIERARKGHEARAVVRMRLENLGTAGAKLETGTLSLVSADLKAFGGATVEPVDGTAKEEIGPGEHAVFELQFPLPDGRRTSEIDFSGLNLRFTLLFGEHRVTTGASFQRVDWRYWDPGSPRVHIGIGYGWTHVD